MTVAELMQTNFKTVNSHATIAEVVVSLSDAHVSGLPVVDDNGRVIGVVSASDVLTAEAEADSQGERRALLDNTAVQAIMTPRRPALGRLRRPGALRADRNSRVDLLGGTPWAK